MRYRWPFWVGFRYLRTRSQLPFLTLSHGFSFLGIFIGVAALVVVLSVMGGFEKQLEKRLLSTSAHILMIPKQGELEQRVLKKTDFLKWRSIRAFVPVWKIEGLLKTRTQVAGVLLKAWDARVWEQKKKWWVSQVDPFLVQVPKGGKRIFLRPFVLGNQLAHQLHLMAGDRVTFLSPFFFEGPLGAVPRMKVFSVYGTYRSALLEQELQEVWTTRKALESFLRKRDLKPSQYELYLQDPQKAAEIALGIQKKWPQFRVRDWFSLHKRLLSSLRLERVSMFIILMLVIVVAMFNIVSQLILTVSEKKKDISIFKTLGATDGDIFSIFLSKGLWVAFLGTVAGFCLGFGVCLFLKWYPILQLPDIYYDRTLPVVFRPWIYMSVSVATFLVVSIGAWYPSKRASQLPPLEGIREADM